MALTADQKIMLYLIPYVVNDSPSIDSALTTLAQQITTSLLNQLTSGVTAIQPRVETLAGQALTPTQLAELRLQLAARINDLMRNINIG